MHAPAPSKWANEEIRSDGISYLLNFSDPALRAGREAQVDLLLDEAVQQPALLPETGTSMESFLKPLQVARFLTWERSGADVFESGSFSAIGYISRPAIENCDEQVNSARQAIMRSDRGAALVISKRLLATGYYEPEFVRFYHDYGLCQ